MTLTEMLSGMSAVEVSQRIALDRIRVDERKQAERMAKAKRRH